MRAFFSQGLEVPAGKDPDYWRSERGVVHDLKEASKGAHWLAVGSHMKAAKRLICELEGTPNLSTRDLQRQARAMANEMAKTFLKVIPGGQFFQAFMMARRHARICDEGRRSCHVPSGRF